MKKLRYYLMLLMACAFVLTGTVSCLDDDDNGSQNNQVQRAMTETEAAYYLMSLSGNYSGWLKHSFPNGTYRGGKDSVNIVWEVNTDSTILIKNVPDSVFHHYVNTVSPFLPIVKAVTTAHDMQVGIKALIAVENTETKTVVDRFFYIAPNNDLHKFNVSGTSASGEVMSSDLEASFVKNYSPSMYESYSEMGVFDESSRKMQLQLLIKGVKIGNYTGSLESPDVFILDGRK